MCIRDSSYAIDLDDSDHLELFQKSARRLTEENEHVAYVAYFKEDTLDYVYPADRFGALIGKDMADFAYSITLAKFAKIPVVEGPASLFGEETDVFLFQMCIRDSHAAIGVPQQLRPKASEERLRALLNRRVQVRFHHEALLVRAA